MSWIGCVSTNVAVGVGGRLWKLATHLGRCGGGDARPRRCGATAAAPYAAAPTVDPIVAAAAVDATIDATAELLPVPVRDPAADGTSTSTTRVAAWFSAAVVAAVQMRL